METRWSSDISCYFYNCVFSIQTTPYEFIWHFYRKKETNFEIEIDYVEPNQTISWRLLIKLVSLNMKGNKKQREKDPLKIKTESPHSIGASTSTKVSNLSKKSQAIQKTHEKSSKVQSKLIPIKNENGTKTLFISKASTSAKVHETRPSKSSSVVAAAQVELKVSTKSPHKCLKLQLFSLNSNNL